MRVLQAQQGLDAGEREPVVVELGRIYIHANRGQRAAAGVDLAHSLDLRELLLHDGGSFVVELAAVVDIGGESDDHNRRVGRVHLAVSGIRGQVRGQVGPRGVDGCFYVARGAVNVAAEVELDGDSGAAKGTGGGHLRNPGDVPQLPLQRSGDGSGHDLGAGAGEPRAYGNGRIIHLGQRRNRQHSESQSSGQGNCQGQQSGGDGPVDEKAGRIHACSASGGCGSVAGFLREPRCANRSKKM